MKIIKRLCISILIFSLFGCTASSGNNFNDKGLNQLQVGITTINDATNLLEAKPAQVINNLNDTWVIWRYITSNGLTMKTEIKSATLIFDKDGKFIKIQQLQNIEPNIL